jgi:hypothetical protein
MTRTTCLDRDDSAAPTTITFPCSSIRVSFMLSGVALVVVRSTTLAETPLSYPRLNRSRRRPLFGG